MYLSIEVEAESGKARFLTWPGSRPNLPTRTRFGCIASRVSVLSLDNQPRKNKLLGKENNHAPS